MVQNRERMYLNIVRGIAIVLMMWGHCIQVCGRGAIEVFENEVFQFIYSFHMPLFMLLSGYLFYYSYEKRDLKTLLVYKTQGMLQPIVFASMLNILLNKFPTLILHRIFHITNGELFYGLFSFWFLWCVLSASIAVAVAGKTVRNPWLRFGCMILGFGFVSLFQENHYHQYMYPYFVAGFYYGMYRNRIPGWLKKSAWVSLLIFPWMLRSYNSWNLIYVTPVIIPNLDLAEALRQNLFRWGIGLAGSLCVLLITWSLCKRSYKKERTPFWMAWLAKLGENSLAVYCISVSLLTEYLSKFCDRLFLAMGRNVLADNILIFNFVLTPLMTVLYGFFLYYVVVLMKKLRIHSLIFGR